MKKLTLKIISQEKKLLELQVDSVTVPSSTGQLTILPGHISLFSKLQTGELIYRNEGKEESVVVTTGFVDVNPEGVVTSIVDTATHARDLSEEAAKKAMADAKATMESTDDRRELIMAEAELKRAMWELRVVSKTKKASV